MLSEERTVLLVDDSADERLLLQHAWRRAKIANPLRMLPDGAQALRYLLGEPPFEDRVAHPAPAFVLLDIKMPGLSGFDVLTRMRADPRLARVPVLMLTASTAPQDVEEAYRLGASAFFVKPSSLGELAELLTGLQSFWMRFNEFP